MTTAQETATHTLGETGTAVVHRPAAGRRRGRLALLPALIVAGLGALAFGIYSAVDGSRTGSDGERAPVRAAATEAQAPMSAAAIEAYGNRWEALGDHWAAVRAAATEAQAPMSAAAIEAYGNRWEALGDHWAALGEQHGVRPVSPETIEADGA